MRVGLKSSDWCPYKKRRGSTEIQREEACEAGNRDWSDIATGQGKPRIVGSH